MEKKVPERKVLLRENDVVYVYDKRINRCVKEDCEGTVKYGLVLRVSVSDTETLNCFECNKCHMKYTPYPNYVRLTRTDMLDIYNKEEVEARDRKRALDAIKHPSKDKKSQEVTSFERKPNDRNSFGKKNFDKKPYGRDSYEGKSFVKKAYGKDFSEKRTFEKKPYEKKSFDKRLNENRLFEGRKPFEKKNESGSLYNKSSYGNKRDYDNNRNISDKKTYDRIPNTNGGYRKPFCSDKSFNNRTNRSSGKADVFLVSGGYRRRFDQKKPEDKGSEE